MTVMNQKDFRKSKSRRDTPARTQKHGWTFLFLSTPYVSCPPDICTRGFHHQDVCLAKPEPEPESRLEQILSARESAKKVDKT